MLNVKVPLRIIVTLFILVATSLSGCTGHRAEERHQKSMELRQQEIERRQLELYCLKRRQADPVIDCSQFHELGGPSK
jgi:hypothetical protein